MFTRFSTWFLLGIMITLFTYDGYPQGSDSKQDPVTAQIPEDQLAARVNDVPITKTELNRATITLQRAISHSKQFQNNPQQIPMDYIKRLALDVLITNELIYQKAVELGIEVTDKELEDAVRLARGDKSEEEFLEELSLKGATPEDFKEGTKKSLYVRKVIMREYPDVNSTVTDKQIKERYDALKDKLSRDRDMIDVSHIVKLIDNDTTDEERIQVKQTLQYAKKLLDEGADWNKIVAQYSDDKKDINGNLGYLAVSSFAENIQQVLRATPTGSITNVIKAGDGFHIIRVNDFKKRGGTMTLSEASKQIKDAIAMERIQKHYVEYIQKLRANAKVEKFAE